MINWFTKIPNWAALSLVMNGLLFGGLLVVWQEQAAFSDSAGNRASGLLLAGEPPIDASITDAAIADTEMALPRPGGDRNLSYEQWVEVLKKDAATMAAKNPEHLTVLLGDSLSLWFPGELMPGRRVWINQSISGERTQGLLKRLDLLEDNDVEAVFLMIGINDLIWGKTDDEIVSNYKEIVRQLKQKHPKTQIVVQSILPHGGENSTWESRDKLLALESDRIVAMNNTLKKNCRR